MIIGLGHRRRTGKDTAARFILSILREHQKYRGKNVQRRGFADPLYDVCYKLYSWAGFQRREYYDEYPAAKEAILTDLGKTPRQILIEIGTPVMRAYDDDVWINAALRSSKPDLLVVPDTRFINEVKAIQNLGGAAVKVIRPGIPESNDVADGALSDFGGWDYTLVNDGTLQDLHSKCILLLQTLGVI